MTRRHDRDAGGPPELLAAKAAFRQEVWRLMEEAGVARFPGAEGRIPNFVGAAEAAARLQETPAWRRATTLKANPDSPQWPVRQRALEDGKVVFMAVPRLAAERPFFRLDPAHLGVPPREAASIKGAARWGVPVDLEELEAVELVVCGCVAVSEDGTRLGKGGGFSDLELAIAAEAGLVGPDTVIATTVHELQVRPAGSIPATDHDFSVDLVVTPERVIDCRARGERREQPRVRWDELTEEKVAAIPVLRRLRAGRRR